ncbi:alpha-ketoglutarate-dependent dioxygenase alkB homolog 3-like [Lineus longissimus]|uniref:alpha-ketoglutarate-dependent dioxygenase alkB homolog 3-like n=1 Tax=Lineus longissimus TaxID=88925 RepID=UPI002B4ED42E
MADDRRRKARVQGGWAGPSKPAPRSDRNKPKLPPTPAWVASNSVDQPALQKKFVYQQPAEGIKAKLPELCITKPGVYDISDGSEGVSRLRFFPEFIKESEASEIFHELHGELPWKQQTNKKYDSVEPRLTVWYGDLAYNYSGVLQVPNPEWYPLLKNLKDRLEEVTGCQFNSMLGNLYRDGKDSIAWHADDEPILGTHPIIASLSFGDSRLFQLRKNVPEGESYDNSQYLKLPLTHGSLLIMEGATQLDWQHKVPKEYHDKGPRINLTFRVIIPE